MNQIDPWRQLLQNQYASGIFGGREGHQAFAGPSSMQAYAMSGQGQYLNPSQGQPAIDVGSGGGMLGGGGGGGIADMIRQYIEQQRAQQSGSGAHLQLPAQPGLLGRY